MSVDHILSSIDAPDGDFIKNQTVSANYYTGVGWFGELVNLEPLLIMMGKKILDTLLVVGEMCLSEIRKIYL